MRHKKTDGTAWFQSDSSERIASPPNLDSRPDIEPGDIYLHILPNDTQMWLYSMDSTGDMRWKVIRQGFSRADGKRLYITDSRRNPSWVTEKWYNTKMQERSKKALGATKKAHGATKKAKKAKT